MLHRLVVALGLIVALMLATGDAKADRRVALVIGNAAYSSAAALRNPRNDAGDMTEALKKLGFEVIVGYDLDQQRFAGVVEQFARMLDDADVALFYYAGHGLQINEKNYLVSVNARLDSEFLISSETLELNAIVNMMESKVPTNLVFLDACRNNPLTENLKKNLTAMKRSAALGRGLARIEASRRDTLIAFAAAPGQEAADGNTRNSPFTSALLKFLPKPDLEVSVMLKLVAAEVGQVTRNAQRPQQLSDMTRPFYFATAKAEEVAKADAAASNQMQQALASASQPRNAGSDDRNTEIAFWNAAQSANDCDAMRAYIQRYPSGVFISLATLAERRLCQSRHVTVIEAAPGVANPAAPQRPAQAAPAPGPAPSAPANAFSLPGNPPVAAPAPAPPQIASRPMPAPEPAPAPSNQQQAFLIKPPLLPAPSAGGSAQSFRDCDGCPEMVYLPGGNFAMGSTNDPSESPVRQVTVRPFAIGRYPVTVGEWKRCVAAKACSYEPAGDDDLPVYNVHWNDTQQYVTWLSGATNAKYRLPTEAEWEYAARGQTSTKYWWGNLTVPGKAACKGCGSEYAGERPMKVGAFPANSFGLQDMTGSISQWVSDCWHRNYAGAPRDGSSWDEPNCRRHVVRGGSWKNDASYARTSSRDSYDTDVRYLAHGFRVVRQ